MQIKFETLDEVRHAIDESAKHCRDSAERMGHKVWNCECGLCAAFRYLDVAATELERFRKS